MTQKELKKFILLNISIFFKWFPSIFSFSKGTCKQVLELLVDSKIDSNKEFKMVVIAFKI